MFIFSFFKINIKLFIIVCPDELRFLSRSSASLFPLAANSFNFAKVSPETLIRVNSFLPSSIGSLFVVFIVILQQIGTFNTARRFDKEINSFYIKIIVAVFLVSFLYINETNPQTALITQDIKIQICSTNFFAQEHTYFSLYLKTFLCK